MATTVQTFLDTLNRIAPSDEFETSLSRLQIGLPTQAVQQVGLSFEPSERLLSQQADLFLTWKPLLLECDQPLDPNSSHAQVLQHLLQTKTALITIGATLSHTSFGPNSTLAQFLNLQDAESLQQFSLVSSDSVTYSVFVPIGHEEAIIEAIAQAGGGIIGNYSHCTFRTPGTGTYRPLQGANPWAGEVGKLESAQETRLEARVPKTRIHDVLNQVRKVHPYEEIAFDIYPRMEPVAKLSSALIGQFSHPTTLRTLIQRLRSQFGAEIITRHAQRTDQTIRRVALCLDAHNLGLESVVEAAPDIAFVESDSSLVSRIPQSIPVLQINLSAIMPSIFRRLSEVLEQEIPESQISVF